MRLSAIDCIGRGVANLRANWELALMQFVQAVVCWLTVALGAVVVVLMLGASFLFQLAESTRLEEVLERLRGLQMNWGLLVILLATIFIVSTLATLAYCWFQAGIFTTLERAERQAPRRSRPQALLFRTFRLRDFVGWANRGVWRYFWFYCWALVVVTVVVALLLAVGGAVAYLAVQGRTGVAFGLGCAGLAPALGLALALSLWMLAAQALLPSAGYGVWRASSRAFRVLRDRLGGALLLLLLFVVASLAVAVVFWPLTQGMTVALGDSTPASLTVQVLLAAAEALASGVLTIALFGSVVALVRTEIDAREA